MQIVDSSVNPCDHSGLGLVVYPLRGFPNAVATLQSDSPSLHRFVVASKEYSASNEIVVLDFDEDIRTTSIIAKVESLCPVQHLVDFSHDAEKPHLFLTEKNIDSNVAYIKIVELDISDRATLDIVAISEAFKGSIKAVSVDPYSTKQPHAKIALVQPASITLLKVSEVNIDTVHRLEIKPVTNSESDYNCFEGYRRRFITGKFDPHHRDIFGCAIADRFELYDWRQSPEDLLTVRSGYCHTGDVLDLDFNPNVPNEVVTVGDDARIAFWDLRATVKPVEVLDSGHKNRIQYVRFNSFHDQLILTGGPSATLLHMREGDITSQVYTSTAPSRGACWSSRDAWHFAALSGNKLLFDAIPASVKYKLLL